MIDLQRIKELEKKAKPRGKIVEMTTFLDKLYCRLDTELEEGEVIMTLTNKDLEQYDEVMRSFSEMIIELRAGRELRKAIGETPIDNLSVDVDSHIMHAIEEYDRMVGNL